MLLTDAKIRSAKPRTTEYRLKDGEGLFLLVYPSGNKYWQLRYRFLDKEKSLSLGRYPRVTLSEARDRKIRQLRQLGEGKDPSAVRKEEKILAVFRDRNSFGAVTQEWLERNRAVWTPRHADRVEQRLHNHILPRLGKRPIGEVLPLELLAVIQEIENSGAVYTAHRSLQMCGAIFNFAIITGRAQHNVTIGLQKALRPHREKHYPAFHSDELPNFLAALERVETREQNRLAFKILLYTAVRTGELRLSKWSDVNLEKGEWRIRAETTKMRVEHFVHLSRQVKELFAELRKLTAHQEWVFPTICGYRHKVMSENTINDMISRMGYKGWIVGHGFRSLFSTVLNEKGFNRDAIERQLAHMERNNVRAAYNRAEYLDERKTLMEWWADFLDQQYQPDHQKDALSLDEHELTPKRSKQRTNVIILRK
ncbi:MAG: integrase arm-type DNA-binding domain-containing protein [Verrucomicrobiota bacterium]